jgi:hypothetical protein
MPTMSRLLPMLSLLLLSPLCQAQVYKWVDAAGHVHFSDTKVDAGRASVEEVRTAPAPDATTTQRLEAIRKQREEEYRQRHPAAPVQVATQGRRAPPEGYYDDKPDSDTAKCRLARDIMSGHARHMSGKPTDAYDKEVAVSDIKNFCR